MIRKLPLALAATLCLAAATADAGTVTGTFAPHASVFTLPGEAGGVSFSTAVSGSLARLSLSSTFSVKASGSFEIGDELVSEGTSVGPATAFSSGRHTFDETTLSLFHGLSVDDQALGTDLLLPFEFKDHGTTDYGWIELDVSKNVLDLYSFHLDGYSYVDNGRGSPPCTTPAVPEPAPVVLMLSALLGFAAWRRAR